MEITLEDAIRFHEEQVKNCDKEMVRALFGKERCEELKTEHIQRAKWLRELQEYKAQPKIITCGECKHKRELHYENPGEEPYIKSICENKYGLTKGYQVHDWDFCSRAERKTDGSI